MSIYKIPLDQRVIDIDSRRFASIEKALVELITNSDDSYSRLESNGVSASGKIRISYERHLNGAVIIVSDQAEGMSFQRASSVLSYGSAYSLLANGQIAGRGYFGRGLKQAVYGLGHGWIETIYEGRISRIDLYRSENGEYLYDDWDGDKPAQGNDYARLNISEGSNATQVTIVIDNPETNILHFNSLANIMKNNIYLREILNRRDIELFNPNSPINEPATVLLQYTEPEAVVLIGPDEPGSFKHKDQIYEYTLTLKKAINTPLILKGDGRTNGLLTVSNHVVFDCQFFHHENQLGTEFLFGTVQCPGIVTMLAAGHPVISDEREGLNLKNAFVQDFSASVSKMVENAVKSEQLRLSHIDHATTSRRTQALIEEVLQQMNFIAADELGITLPAGSGKHRMKSKVRPAALRFATPFYYQKVSHPFSIKLAVDRTQLRGQKMLSFVYELPESMKIDPQLDTMPLSKIPKDGYFRWIVTGTAIGEYGKIEVGVGSYSATCEIVIAEEAPKTENNIAASDESVKKSRPINYFKGYELRNLGNDLDRAVFSPEEQLILINTEAPTVRLYVNGHGQFKDGARLLLAELLLDVITDELAQRYFDLMKKKGEPASLKQIKQDFIRRYGLVIHSILLGGH